MASKYPESNNENAYSSTEPIYFCKKDQKKPGSCSANPCDGLHFCREYLLKRKCSIFEMEGKCLHSHSFWTMQNDAMIKKKLGLTDRNENIFDRVAQAIKDFESNRKTADSERRRITDDDDSILKPSNPQTNSLRTTKSCHSSSGHYDTASTNSYGISSFLYNNDSPRSSTSHSLSGAIHQNDSLEPISLPLPLSPSKSLDFSFDQKYHIGVHHKDFDEKKLDHIDSTDDEDIPQRLSKTDYVQTHAKKTIMGKEASVMDKTSKKGDSQLKSSKNSSIKERITSYTVRALEAVGLNKDKSSSASPNEETRLAFMYGKPLSDESLCSLLGPIRRELIKNNFYQISASGYCQLNDRHRAYMFREIDKRLKVTLSPVKITISNKELFLVTSTNAAERIFEKNKCNASIMTKPYQELINIEVVKPSSSSCHGAYDVSPVNSSSNEKCRIPCTNSSINVICGDITQIRVDMLVCVTTSAYLLDNILKKAGPKTHEEYNCKSSQDAPFCADGGHLNARKILFIPWKLEVRPSELQEAKESLSDLVRTCMQKAEHLRIQSISFPAIGTGNIGLAPEEVCESMMNAAWEYLQKITMDLTFVIYSVHKDKENDPIYKTFCRYINKLRRQIQAPKNDDATSSVRTTSTMIPISTSKTESRLVKTKEIYMLSSDPNSIAELSKYVTSSLESLLVKYRLKLTDIQSQYYDNVDDLINLCFLYHVIPSIDYFGNGLTLCGDYESCAQCIRNLKQGIVINQYILRYEKGQHSKKTEMNMYTSLKIDEASAMGEPEISIEIDNLKTLIVNLQTSKMRIKGENHSISYSAVPIDVSKLVSPTSWPSTRPIKTIEIPVKAYGTVEFVQIFENSMNRYKWNILRIEEIRNLPVHAHCARKCNKHTEFRFYSCPASFVQSVIHYGLHTYYDGKEENPIVVYADPMMSHMQRASRSTDGEYYMFAVKIPKELINARSIKLSDDDAYFALPTHLIVYRRQP